MTPRDWSYAGVLSGASALFVQPPSPYGLEKDHPFGGCADLLRGCTLQTSHKAGRNLVFCAPTVGGFMRRSALLLVIMALALLVASGVALAKTINCNGGLCFGTKKPDSIFGTNRHDTVFARAGGDFVSGAGGADDLNGEYGNDKVLGGRGDDWVKGGRHDDMVKGEIGR